MDDPMPKSLETRLLYLSAKHLDDCLSEIEHIELKRMLMEDHSCMRVFAQFCMHNQIIEEVHAPNMDFGGDMSDSQLIEAVTSPQDQDDVTRLQWGDITGCENATNDELVHLDPEKKTKLEKMRERLGKKAATNKTKNKSHMIVIPKPLFYGAIAAMLTFVVLIFTNNAGHENVSNDVLTNYKTMPIPVATLISQDDAAWTRDGLNINNNQGTTLFDGHYILNEGKVSIMFNRGAETTITAPAIFELKSTMLCNLIKGNLSAHIPPTALGFQVDVPGGRVVDWGTDFNLEVNDTGHCRAEVTKGAVTIATLGNSGKALDEILLSKDDIAVLDSVNLSLIKYAESKLKIPNTGQNIGIDGIDKNWKISKISGVDEFTKFNAWVLKPSQLGGWEAESEAANWLSPMHNKAHVNGGAIVRFETKFNISDDANLKRIKVIANAAYDDTMVQVLINGKPVWHRSSIENNKESRKNYNYTNSSYLVDFDLSKGKYKHGVNTISFDVENINNSDNMSNAIGLIVEFDSTIWQLNKP